MGHSSTLRKGETGEEGPAGLPRLSAGTLAFCGPDDRRASTVVLKVSGPILEDGNDEAVRMRTWQSEEADVRHDAEIVADVLAFMGKCDALSVAMPDGIFGCPHEEGINDLGPVCPQCPFFGQFVTGGRKRSFT